MAKKKTINWKDKRCPKCGSPVDILETCRKCGRPWTPELEKDTTGHIVESAIGLEDGQQFESIVKKVGSRKPRKSKCARTPAELAGKKFRTFGDDLPPQFKDWEIKDNDPEPEIWRKRSLMRLSSRVIYNQMGLSVRAQESSKAATLWLARLWGFLEPEEQKELAPTLEHLKEALAVLTMVRMSKVAQAEKMEKAMEKAYKQARKARMAAVEQKKKDASKFPAPEQSSEGEGILPVGIDPKKLIEKVQAELVELDETKKRNKSSIKL